MYHNVKQAFSLLELLLVMAIVAILGMATASHWQNLLQRNRSQVFTQNLVEMLNLAKSMGETCGEKVRICKSVGKTSCGGAEVRWQDGQIVKIVSSGRVIWVGEKLKHGDELTWKASLTKQDFLDFYPDGSTNGIQGSFHYWPDKAHNVGCDNCYTVNINFNGRIRVENG